MRFGIGGAVVVAMMASACSGAKLNQKEAEAVFAAQNKVVGDVYGSVYDAVVNANVPDGITVSGDTSDGSVSGTLEGGQSWEGSVEIDGSVQSDVEAGTFALDSSTVYTEVVVEDLVLDGDTALIVDVAIDEAAGTIAFAFETAGSLDVTGDAEGHGDFNYALSVDVNVNTGAFSFSSDGDINGYATADMSLANLASWVLALYS